MATPVDFSVDLGYPIDADQVASVQDATASTIDTLTQVGGTDVLVSLAEITQYSVSTAGTFMAPGGNTPQPFSVSTGFAWAADQTDSIQAAQTRFSTLLTQMGFRHIVFTYSAVTEYTVTVTGTYVAPGG